MREFWEDVAWEGEVKNALVFILCTLVPAPVCAFLEPIKFVLQYL